MKRRLIPVLSMLLAGAALTMISSPTTTVNATIRNASTARFPRLVTLASKKPSKTQMAGAIGTINSRTVCALGSCVTCDDECFSEAWDMREECFSNGGSRQLCDRMMTNQYCFCLSTKCRGCDRPVQCGPVN